MNPLGVPWHPIESKGQDFQSMVSYIGFIWSLENHSVSLSYKKCSKYLSKVSNFLSNATNHIRNASQSMACSSTYLCILGWPCIPTPLPSFLSRFPNHFIHHHVPKPVIESLCWWQAILCIPCKAQLLFPRHLVNPDIWVDASTDWGIGVVIGYQWVTWKLVEACSRLEI